MDEPLEGGINYVDALLLPFWRFGVAVEGVAVGLPGQDFVVEGADDGVAGYFASERAVVGGCGEVEGDKLGFKLPSMSRLITH